MIEVKKISKTYGSKKAVKEVSFSVKQGEILGFLGVNGAGKSTTLNMITGYVCPSSGDVVVDGDSVIEDPLKAKKKIGYLPELPSLYLDMTVLSYLKFCCDIKKIKLKNKLDYINNVCKKLDILDVQKRIIKNLSKGYKQRVGLAAALLGEPPVIVLDEPSVGLDPRQVVEMRALIKELGKKHTVILSSHILSEVQEICSRILIINNGVIVADESTENVVQKLSSKGQISLKVEGPNEKVSTLLESVEGICEVTTKGNAGENIFEYNLSFGNLPELQVRKNIFFALSKNGFPLLDICASDSSLESLFLMLTSNAPKGGAQR